MLASRSSFEFEFEFCWRKEISMNYARGGCVDRTAFCVDVWNLTSLGITGHWKGKGKDCEGEAQGKGEFNRRIPPFWAAGTGE